MSDIREQLRLAGLRFVARLLPSPQLHAGPPRRLLLIRPDHLGDVLLTSPAIAVLREALPEAHLTLLVGPWSEEMARRGAAVDAIQTCEFPGFTRRPKSSGLDPYRLLLREGRRLRGRYDLAVVFRPDHWWGALLAAAAGIPIRLGYDTPGTRPFLTESLSLPKRIHVARLSLGLVDRAIELALSAHAAALHLRRPPHPPNPGGLAKPPRIGGVGGLRGRGASRAADRPAIFRLSADERAWAASLAAADDRPLVLLHPGSGSPLKNWPADRWAAVADALTEHGARIVLTGGPDEPAGPRAVAARMRYAPLLLAGETTLGQLGALIERCRLAIGTDSGPMHLAAAVGTPTLRLYGPTDEALFGPWGKADNHQVLTHPIACRPCGNLVDPPCGATREPACLQGIEVSRVVEMAARHLSPPAHLPAPARRELLPAPSPPPRAGEGAGGRG